MSRATCTTVLLFSLFTVSRLLAQDVDGSKLVDFGSDIQPILELRCLSCHGPDEAKNDFRVDDRETLLAYLEPGDLESSSLWADYLVTDDSEMIMPPSSATHAGGLSARELLFVRAWIEEGAEGEWVVSAAELEAVAEDSVPVPASKLAKLWAFQGIFHPASVHFPVALLVVSAGFVFLSFFNRDACEPVAFHCLWIGALGAVAACASGWSYAVHEGYGQGFSFDLGKSSIDRHRWAGVFVAVFSLMMIPIASSVRRSGSFNKRLTWLVGACLIAGAVSLAGYQGGELTFGEDHYAKEFSKLFPSESSDESSDEVAESGLSEGESDAGEASSEDSSTEDASSTNANLAEPESSAAQQEEQTAAPEKSATEQGVEQVLEESTSDASETAESSSTELPAEGSDTEPVPSEPTEES